MVLLALTVLGLGVKSYNELPIDAFPDISPTQVKMIMKSEGMTPSEIESQITIPIEMSMSGIPKKTIMRSISKYGLCDITLDFEEGTDIYWARQQVSERLADIKDSLPSNLEGGLAPISTPLSDILMFTIESDTLTLTQKRTLLDWIISPKIRSVAGVAEVNALGGKVKTYEIVPNLKTMQSLGIDLEAIFATLQLNNKNGGAGRISQGVENILVRSVGKLSSMDDIRSLPIESKDGRIVTIGEVAKVKMGYITGKTKWQQRDKGLPQGAVLSPLLANLYLSPLDQRMKDLGIAYVRYADDFVILTKEQSEAEEILHSTVQYIESKLMLQLNRGAYVKHTRHGFKFLGVWITNQSINLPPQKAERIKSKITNSFNHPDFPKKYLQEIYTAKMNQTIQLKKNRIRITELLQKMRERQRERGIQICTSMV